MDDGGGLGELGVLEAALSRAHVQFGWDGVRTATAILAGAVGLGLVLDLVEGGPTARSTLSLWWDQLPLFVWGVWPLTATLGATWVSRRWARRGAWVALASTGRRAWPMALSMGFALLCLSAGGGLLPASSVVHATTNEPVQLHEGAVTEVWVGQGEGSPVYGVRLNAGDVVGHWVGDQAYTWDGTQVRSMPVPTRPPAPTSTQPVSVRWVWAWLASVGAVGGALWGRRSFWRAAAWCVGVAVAQGLSWFGSLAM